MKTLGQCLSSLTLLAITALGAEVPKDPEEMAGYFLRQMTRLNFDEIEEHASIEDANRYKALHVRAAQLAEQTGSKRYFEYLVTWAESSEEIEKMPARKVYGAFIRSLLEMQRTKFPDLYASLVKQGEASKIEVIGHTMDGVDRMLVNYRVTGTVGGKAFTKTEVLPLRKEGEVWMLGIQDENFTKMTETIGQLQKTTGEQGGGGQPATRSESK
jgi:hypothetical protein